MTNLNHKYRGMSAPVHYLLLCLLLATLAACHNNSENGPRPREPHFDLKNECKSFGPANSRLGFLRSTIGVQYEQPRFNPHNSAELLYHVYGEGEENRVVVYNMDTREKRTLTTSTSTTLEIDWGRAGWIALSNYKDMELIKEDGTQGYTLSIPTNDPGYSCAEPDFNPDGTTVGFPFGGADGISLYGMYLLYDLESGDMDTFKQFNGTRPLDWSIKNFISIWTGSTPINDKLGIAKINTTSYEESLIFEYEDMKWLDNTYGSPDMMWNHTGDVLYYTGGDIICFPTTEYKEIRIKKGCESRYYEDISISPDNRHIVVERVDLKRQGPFSNVLEERHRLFIMDIDGCNERLLLDE